MKVIISAGGTGGHIYPALAVIDKINKVKSNDVLYIGTTNRMESKMIPSLGIKYEGIEIYGLSKNIPRNIKNIFKIISSYKKCKKIMKEYKPDAVIGFGGYVTLPVLIAAKKLKIKTYAHEQNSIPGKVNKIAAKYCDKIFVSIKSSGEYFDKNKVIYSGNPAGERAVKMKQIDKKTLGFSKNKKLIVIVMGSLGSTGISERIINYLKTFKDNDSEILYITGSNLYEKIKSMKLPKSVKVVEYFDNLPGLMKSSDLLISRAGASVISEIMSVEVPSILIPSPNVANNHQYYNAKSISDEKACVMLEEDKVNNTNLNKMIEIGLKQKDEIKTNLKRIKKDNGAEVIYNEIRK